MHWSEGVLAVIDTETTGTDIHSDRIVQLAFVLVDSTNKVLQGSYVTLVDPGVEIPPDASAVHGFTTERVQREGVTTLHAMHKLHPLINAASLLNIPLVMYNAPFDWPLILNEMERSNLGSPYPIERLRNQPPDIIDPLLLDRHFDQYRKGSRKLEDVAAHYGYKLEGAHDAYEDALATARIVRELPKRHVFLLDTPIEPMMQLQSRWYDQWAKSVNAFWERIGKPQRVMGTWPNGPEPIKREESA